VIRQSDLTIFAEGRDPRALACGDDEDLGGVSPPAEYRGRRCARCGHPLGRGGNVAVGWGLLCWDCFTDRGLGRRDGRASASSDPDAERNSGYGWR